MGYNFVGVDRDQPFILPPSLRDWLPEDHLAWFIIDAVSQFDLTDFTRVYRVDGRGGAAHDPAMMVALLLYAYCTGVVSSRKIEKACLEDVAFRVVAGNLVPDHTTIARFRKNHEDALTGLFTQVLMLCGKAGLVKVGTVAVDGTKMPAAASMSASRTKATIEKQIAELMDAAASTDAAEDAAFGEARRGDEVPEDLKDRSHRRQRLAAAKQVLEDEEKAAQGEYEAHLQRRAAQEAAQGKKLRGRKPKPPGQKAGEKAKTSRANTTDPDSRMMSSKTGWQQAYNAQAVTNEDQVIIAAEVCQDPNDKRLLGPMIEATERELTTAGIDEAIGTVLVDNGYCSEEVLAALPPGPDFYIAARNMRHGAPRVSMHGPLPADASLVQQMDRKVSRKAGRAIYSKRQWMIEPVFGQTKTGRGIRSFARRGLAAVTAEWKLIASTHNLLKLYRHTTAAPAAAVAG